MSVLGELEKAKELGRRIKKANNDVTWMEHCVEVRKNTLAQKKKQLTELIKEVPELEQEVQDREEHLTKIRGFLVKHGDALDDIKEIENVTAKMEKLVREIDNLKKKLTEKIEEHAAGRNNPPT